jgi:hypothetical protein
MQPRTATIGSNHLLINIRVKHSPHLSLHHHHVTERNRPRRFFYAQNQQQQQQQQQQYHVPHPDDAGMALSYKTQSVRQDDNDDRDNDRSSAPRIFYVTGYGAHSMTQESSRSLMPNTVRIHFCNERIMERMDVLWTPELTVTPNALRNYRHYLPMLNKNSRASLRLQMNGNNGVVVVPDINMQQQQQQQQQQQNNNKNKNKTRNYQWALMRQDRPQDRVASEIPSPSPSLPVRIPAHVSRHCEEFIFRAVVLSLLLEYDMRDAYRVYAALSPLHERSLEEVQALANARSLHCDVLLTIDEVRLILQWFKAHALVMVPVYMPLVTNGALSMDYDHCLGRCVRHALGTAFTLAPGTELSEKDYIEKRRTEMRRSVHAYRQERTLDILLVAQDLITSDLKGVGAEVQRLDILRNRGLSARRILFEHDIVRDVLRVHRMGAINILTTHKYGDGSGKDDEDDAIIKQHLPRKIERIISTCSYLPDTPMQASPRCTNDATPSYNTPSSSPRLCNTWESYTRYASAVDGILVVLAKHGIVA